MPCIRRLYVHRHRPKHITRVLSFGVQTTRPWNPASLFHHRLSAEVILYLRRSAVSPTRFEGRDGQTLMSWQPMVFMITTLRSLPFPTLPFRKHSTSHHLMVQLVSNIIVQAVTSHGRFYCAACLPLLLTLTRHEIKGYVSLLKRYIIQRSRCNVAAVQRSRTAKTRTFPFTAFHPSGSDLPPWSFPPLLSSGCCFGVAGGGVR